MKGRVLLFILVLAAAWSQAAVTDSVLPGFQAAAGLDEQTLWITNELGVRIYINAPAPADFAAQKTVKLIFYGLPNGNTIEQTVGRKMAPGDDWHFNIQHIGAQTRFLRQMLKDEIVVVAYLENSLKSWPAWRKKNGDQTIPAIFEAVKKNFKNYPMTTGLTGHSGGGSLIFGYLNCVENIPDDVERIAFLDSNYAYETEKHRDKLVNWLKASEKHFLTVLAYHDDIALLNGKTFVSAAGGTWGRSHLMKKDFESAFKFSENILPEWENYSALDGRVKFFLKENPDKKVLHTVQVERNGFIHALVAGTPDENKGYSYFGEHVYARFIQPQ